MPKVVVITGGTRGIGRALVAAYLASGFYVATFSRDVVHTKQLRADYPHENKLYIETFDVRDRQASRTFIQTVVERWGGIQVYFFNSGVCQDKTFSKMTAEQWSDVIAVNLTAAFDITQAVFQHMQLISGHKKIFFLTSLSGIEGGFGQANYSVSKAGLIGLTKTLALEGQRNHIEVNAIAPAALTDMTRPIIEQLATRCQQEAKPFPDYWRIGTAQEAAEKIYLLSTKSNLGTGQVFAVNGESVACYQPAVKITYDLGYESSSQTANHGD